MILFLFLLPYSQKENIGTMIIFSFCRSILILAVVENGKVSHKAKYTYDFTCEISMLTCFLKGECFLECSKRLFVSIVERHQRHDV